MLSIPKSIRAFTLLAFGAAAQSASLNTITFDNQSGADALVKTVGPSRAALPVPSGSRATLHADPGKYYILVRYAVAGRYTYSKGSEFSIESRGSSYEAITITLHKVVSGNYATSPASQAEFERQ